MIEGIDTNLFTDKQLLPVENAIKSTFNTKFIVNKKTMNKKVYYLLQYANKDRLWISQENLSKDNLKTFIDDYETNQSPESYIDMKVRKKFNDGKMYDGEVIKYDKKNNSLK